MRAVMVTTDDNPYDYFDQFEQWKDFDENAGYNTLSYLARVANVSDDMPDSIYNKEVERAVDEICYFNLTGNYKKIVRDVEDE